MFIFTNISQKNCINDLKYFYLEFDDLEFYFSRLDQISFYKNITEILCSLG